MRPSSFSLPHSQPTVRPASGYFGAGVKDVSLSEAAMNDYESRSSRYQSPRWYCLCVYWHHKYHSRLSAYPHNWGLHCSHHVSTVLCCCQAKFVVGKHQLFTEDKCASLTVVWKSRLGNGGNLQHTHSVMHDRNQGLLCSLFTAIQEIVIGGRYSSADSHDSTRLLCIATSGDEIHALRDLNWTS